ncbi:MAG: right-handed parallel beta-helix repeat-containing protein [Gammaproteobacteria bacterium]
MTCILLLSSGLCFSRTLTVGKQYGLNLPSQAAQFAKDGDVVFIQAGVYSGDVAVWPQNNLTIIGMDRERAHVKSEGRAAEDKAIWVIKGDGIRIENIEFSGAKSPSLNGAGIRFEGTNLILRNCHIHDNQMGILTGSNPLSEIIIEGSEFNDNTVDYTRHGKLGHNIYIGDIRRFTLHHSYVHDAETGHNVKSRAQENYLLYNRIDDQQNASSYLVDLPDGGDAYLVGNQFRQSPKSENSAMLSFAAEHNQEQAENSLYIINNTFVNDRNDGIFLNNHSQTTAVLINNLFVGPGKQAEGLSEGQHNLNEAKFSFVGATDYDYHLPKGSPAIDQGVEPNSAANGFTLRPKFEYVHPLSLTLRRERGAIDVGAYEYEPLELRR